MTYMVTQEQGHPSVYRFPLLHVYADFRELVPLFTLFFLNLEILHDWIDFFIFCVIKNVSIKVKGVYIGL